MTHFTIRLDLLPEIAYFSSMSKSSSRFEYWFIFQNDSLLLSISKDQMPILSNTDITSIQSALQRQHLIKQIDQFDAYCAELPPDHPLPDHVHTIPVRQALQVLGDDWFELAAKAYGIINWDKHHQFCGRCGQPTKQPSRSFERICTACDHTFYPRISPSVIVLIERGDELLMARSPHFTKGAYGLIAGFIEAGENCEAAVHREVQEEVGIKIHNLQYFGSQAWPVPDSLLMAYTAEYLSGDLQIDPVEIEAAGWYRYTNLPGRPSYSISIGAKLIDHFISQRELIHGPL